MSNILVSVIVTATVDLATHFFGPRLVLIHRIEMIKISFL